jgi:hypothetical protein
MPRTPQQYFKLVITVFLTSVFCLAQAAPPKDFGTRRMVTPEPAVIQLDVERE